MSRPLHRGVSGARIFGGSQDFWDFEEGKIDKEDLDKGSIFDQNPLTDTAPTKYGSAEKFSSYDPFSVGSLRSRNKIMIFLLELGLLLILLLSLFGSFWWTISLSTSSRGHILNGYRQLQQKLVSDLLEIGELSRGPVRLKEMDFCSQEYEYYVPCVNNSDNGNEVDRQCGLEPNLNCLVLPPVNYKIPLRWPTGRDVIWVSNVKITAQQVLSSGSFTKRMMMLEEEQISFRSSSFTLDGVEDYSHQIAEMIGLRNESNFIQAGVRIILDIGCGYGSFGAHLFSSQLLTICIANYESSGSQVQLSLERGLPAMIGSMSFKQLPFPSLSFDMLHCARCGIDWDQKGGILLIEADRLLKPGGYFVWTSPLISAAGFPDKENQKRVSFIRKYAENICWEMLAQQEETIVWRKTTNRNCYTARKPSMGPSLCSKGHDAEIPYHHPLENCLGGTHSRRWISVEDRPNWPDRAFLNEKELAIHGLQFDEFAEDSDNWKTAVLNYWSLLSPLIFSDHPKRPGDEDPLPPYNMLRNVLDMNAHFGGFNSALLQTGKNVWVMNVVPTTAKNYLPLILDRGFLGVLHDWCEAFSTYPRTYDLVHANGLLSLETSKQRGCTVLDLFTEIDRILRPEGWVIVRDTAVLIDSARALTANLKWDARIIEMEGNSDEKLLLCQKPFFKRQAS